VGPVDWVTLNVIEDSWLLSTVLDLTESVMDATTSASYAAMFVSITIISPSPKKVVFPVNSVAVSTMDVPLVAPKVSGLCKISTETAFAGMEDTDTFPTRAS
jgi:hypothetical protein